VVIYVGSCVVVWGVYVSWRVVYEALWVLRWCWVTIHVDGRCVLVVMGRGGLWCGCGRLWWVVCESRMVVGV